MATARSSGSVIRVHESVGSSRTSWETAAGDALRKAKTDVPDPVGLEVVRLWADVKAGKPTMFHAAVKVAYRQRLVPGPRKRAAR